jgi:prepilin-type N-terminal cleavage/methylation domain-containing protein
MKTERRSRKIHFTLIELLVVVAIIALLAGMLLPVLAKSRDKSRQAVCIGNVKQVIAGFAMYQDDFDGYFVQAGSPPWGTAATYPNGQGGGFVDPMWGYVSSAKSFICPMDSTYDCLTEGTLTMWSKYLEKIDGSATPPGNVKLSYGYNYRLGEVGIRNSDIPQPDATVIFIDMAERPYFHLSNSALTNMNPVRGGPPLYLDGFAAEGPHRITKGARHLSKSQGSAAYADGHAGSVNAKDVDARTKVRGW